MLENNNYGVIINYLNNGFFISQIIIVLGKEKCDICDEEIFEGDSCYEIDSLIYYSEFTKIHVELIGVQAPSQGSI